MKAGIKTTEFWVTIATVVIVGLIATGVITQSDVDKVQSSIAAAAAAATSIIYTMQRTKAKNGGSQ